MTRNYTRVGVTFEIKLCSLLCAKNECCKYKTIILIYIFLRNRILQMQLQLLIQYLCNFEFVKFGTKEKYPTRLGRER